MASYLIKKNDKTNEIVYMEYNLEGYQFSPSLNREAILKVDHVTIIKPSMIEKVLIIKFNNTYKKLVTLVMQVINDDEAGDETCIIALDEIARLRGILLNKYNKFLSKEKEKEFSKKIKYLEKELRYKQLLINEKNIEKNFKETKSRSR